jgi:predicted MPP superfamily phosphohydrolase
VKKLANSNFSFLARHRPLGQKTEDKSSTKIHASSKSQSAQGSVILIKATKRKMPYRRISPVSSFSDEHSHSEIDTASQDSENPNPPQNVKKMFGVPIRKIALFVLAVAVVSGVALGTRALIRGGNETTEKPILRFRKKGDSYLFKIVQLADIHLGDAEGTERGASQDAKTLKLIDSILREEQPDLIVLSGDQLTGENVRENATDYYRLIGSTLSQHGIPWAMIFGTHDDMDYHEPLTQLTFPALHDRHDLLQVDQSFHLSLTQRGPESLFGITNYMLNVLVEDEPAAALYFFDTGGGSIPKQLQQNQVNWFYESNQRLPAVAFQHFPPSELKYTDKCMGSHEEETDPLEMDPGIVNAMSESTRVNFMAVGHNHGNDFCCPFSKWMQACFARHSGYGGYGSWERGARVFELEIVDPTSYKMKWRSWVRLESGGTTDDVTMSDMIKDFI